MKKNRLILAFFGCLFFFFSEAQTHDDSATTFEQKIEEYIASDNLEIQRKGLSAKLSLAKTEIEKEAIQLELQKLRNAEKIDASSREGNLALLTKEAIQKEDERIWKSMVDQLRGEEGQSQDLYVSNKVNRKVQEFKYSKTAVEQTMIKSKKVSHINPRLNTQSTGSDSKSN